MNRRTFLCGLALGTLTAPLAAEAQPVGKAPRIGFLSGSSPADTLFLDVFRQGLRELGWVEGQSIAIEYRFAEGRFDRLPDLAAELVRLKVDIIVANPTAGAVAAKNATATIPIVGIALSNPVELGLNRKTAKALGVTIPPVLLLRADQVIE